MKKLTALFAVAALTATAGIAQARDLGPDEALKLRDAGTIQSFEKLNEAALAAHPGGKLGDTELEEEYGRYLYPVSYTHLTLPRIERCRSRWSPYH